MASVSRTWSFNSRVQGPISSGRMTEYARRYSDDVAKEIAEKAEDVALHRFDEKLRHQTPYYTTRINTRRLGAARYELHDNGVIYGHWLEGTGSRNPVTRFKGYWTFRYTEIHMKHERRNIARRILRSYRARGMLI